MPVCNLLFTPREETQISTASTLLNRASNIPSTSSGKSKEMTYVTNTVVSNGYPQSFISNILRKKPPPEATSSPEELVGMFLKWVDPPNPYHGFAVLPFIKGLTEPLTRLLRNNGIRTTSRPLKTLKQNFFSPKSRPPPVDQQTNVVYKLPCADCSWSYIGEAGRCLKTRISEHIGNTKSFKKVPTLQHMHGWMTTLHWLQQGSHNRQGKFPR